MSDLKKILIIRLSSIGDILLTTPFIRQTRKTFPDSQIDFLIKSEYSELLENNPHISNLIKFHTTTGISGLKELKYLIIENAYDYIFDLHNNMRSNYLRRGLRSKTKDRIKKNKLIQFLYVKFKINRYSGIIPIPERYLNVGKPSGINDDNAGLEIFWNNEYEESAIKILEENGIKQNEIFYALGPGAGFYTKRWPLEYYQVFVKNILEKHHCKVVVLGDDNDRQQGDILKKHDTVIDLTGQLSLLQSAVVLSKSRALISNDTGLMHMATAVKAPLLAIFGSTVKEFGFFPYRSESIVVENKDLKCRPCSHIGKHECPKQHFKCMKEITPEIIEKKFEKLIMN